MPPTTLPASSKIKLARAQVNSGVSSADARRNVRGMTADNFKTNSMVQSGALPQSQMETTPQRTGFMVDMPSTIPAEALNGKYSVSDVRAMRDNRAQADAATAQFNTDYSNLTSRIGNTQLSSPFVNPEETLNRLLLRGTTDTQRQLDEQGQTQADAIRGFAGDYTQAGADARTQFGIPELQTNLADTRNRIAERQVKLRETLRDFETNAERRGVAREFVDSEKAKVQSDAAAELADLSIIESAQLGNLNEARAEVDDILAEKKQAFEFENAAIEAEIQRLEKMDTRESQARSEQLQIALQERTRNIETALANEKEQRGYMVDAAANGADQGTLAAIRNAKTPQEAAFLAGPFIGRMDRLQAEASIRASNASAALNEAELTAFNKAQEDAANGVLTPEQMDMANDVNKDFEEQPIVKSYNEGLQKYLVLEDTLANGIDGIQDLQLVYDFMKAVDEDSVVREVEFDNAAKTGNIFQGTYARFNKAFGSGGFLPDEVKQDFIRAARMSFEAKNSQYFNLKSEYAKRMNNTLGVNNGADYLTAYEGAAPLTQADFSLADSLINATEQDLIDIMQMSEGLVGADIYK